MAYAKKKKTNQKSCQKKTRPNQVRQRKLQVKHRRQTRCKQAPRHVKTNSRRMNSGPTKGCKLTKKARGMLSSCVEGLCQEVSWEANRMRKKIDEPKISHKVLLTALEQSMANENIWRSLTQGAKKPKKKKPSPVGTTQKTPRPTEKRAAPTKMLPKARKASPVFHKCS